MEAGWRFAQRRFKDAAPDPRLVSSFTEDRKRNFFNLSTLPISGREDSAPGSHAGPPWKCHVSPPSTMLRPKPREDILLLCSVSHWPSRQDEVVFLPECPHHIHMGFP